MDIETANEVGELSEGDVVMILGEATKDTSCSDIPRVPVISSNDPYMLFPVLTRLGVGWVWTRALETR